MVHAEIVLQRHRRVGLRDVANFHSFLCLECLVQAIAVATPLHHTSGRLIDNLDFTVLHDVLFVPLEQCERLEQLIYGVDALRLRREVLVCLGLGFSLFLVAEAIVLLNAHHYRPYVWQHKQVLVVLTLREVLRPLVEQLNLTIFLVDVEVEFVIDEVHALGVLLHVVVLGLLQDDAHAVFGQKLDQGSVFWECTVGAQQGHAAFAFFDTRVASRNQLACLSEVVGREPALLFDESLHQRLELLVLLLLTALGHRARDDQRRTCIVDEHRVHLVDHGVVVLALHFFGGGTHHVVAQVVKPELVVGAVGDVGQVGGTTLRRVWPVLVDAVDREPKEVEDRCVPLLVALGEVVVNGDDVYALTGHAIEVGR